MKKVTNSASALVNAARAELLGHIGNVDIIGYDFSMQLKKQMYSRDLVLMAAERQGFDPKAFPEPTKRNSFKNAMNAQMRIKKESDRVLHKSDENESVVVYQIDRKILEDSSLWGNSSDGGSAEVAIKSASYETELTIVYDKGSDRVICQNSELLMAVYKLLGVYMESYTKQTLTRYLLKMLEKTTSFVPYIKGTGVYYIPSYERSKHDSMIEFMYELDNCKNCRVRELADLPNSREEMAISVIDSFGDMKAEQLTEIEKFVTESKTMTETMKTNRLNEIAQRGTIIEQYEILLNKELKEAKKFVTGTEKMVKNFFKYGTVENPFQKIVDGAKGDELAMDYIKSNLPDDVLEYIDFD